MSKDNPFASKPNPFAVDDELAAYAAGVDPATVATATNASGAWGSSKSSKPPGAGAWSNGAAAKPYEAPAVMEPAKEQPVFGQGSLRSKEAELAKKEAELNKKEQELQRLEIELRRSGAIIRKKNFPRCCPIVHHDIRAEVPQAYQGMVTKVFWSYLGLALALTWNFIGTIIALIVLSTGNNRLPSFFLGAIYLLAGVPGAWVLWYRRLYNAAIKDRAMTYAWYFLAYCVHIAFCIWSAVAPPILGNDWSHTGFLVAIKAFDGKTIVGIIYVVGGVLWSVEALWSLICLKLVYSAFRGGGGEARLKREVASSAVQQAVNNATHTNAV